ncbi:hypothetical protein WMZ97_07275 [Lentibacillus sp. N15]|uniref:hypothetical protein n=1 Tax=Lentibacillus songyuanensis TaxID=3136161 RepID=UPI0031BB3E17
MKKPWYKHVWIWVITAVVILVVAKASIDRNEEVESEPVAKSESVEEDIVQEGTETNTNEGATDESAETDDRENEDDTDDLVTESDVEDVSLEESPQEKILAKLIALMDEEKAFDTGSYVEGDIPKGEYAFVKFDGSGEYYSEEDSAGNIIDNENFSSFGYVYVHGAANLTTQGVLVHVDAFDDLEVSGAKEIYELLNNKEDYQEAGMYKIGYDLKPGDYTIESYGQGYVAVLTGPVGDNEIVNNENFNGKFNVSVSDGHYLEISRGVIADRQVN